MILDRRALTAIAASMLLGAAVGATASSVGLKALRITSESMQPTVHIGQWVVARSGNEIFENSGGRDLIAVLGYPLGSTSYAIKRVVAVAGDAVTVQADVVVVNGNRIEVRSPVGSGQHYMNLALHRLAPGTVFVLGDNTAASIDSRAFGPVAKEDLVGYVLFVVPQFFAYAGAGFVVAGFLAAALLG